MLECVTHGSPVRQKTAGKMDFMYETSKKKVIEKYILVAL